MLRFLKVIVTDYQSLVQILKRTYIVYTAFKSLSSDLRDLSNLIKIACYLNEL